MRRCSWQWGRGWVGSERSRRRYGSGHGGNLALLRRMGEETPGRLEMQEVEAGWSAVLALPGCVGERDCAERLVRERGVVVQPGWFYGIGMEWPRQTGWW